MTLLSNFVQLFVESAPWLMLGLLVAGLLKGFIPTDFLARHLGKPGFFSTVKAALLGAPLPLCSCGVIPAALGLRRSGASKAATTSFLISTPETGVDSISISYALLGPFMAVIRPIAAVTSAIAVCILIRSMVWLLTLLRLDMLPVCDRTLRLHGILLMVLVCII